MIKRIFRAICLVAFAVFIASVALIMGVLYGYFSNVQQNQLKMQTQFMAKSVSNEGIAYLGQFEMKNLRITWIDEKGNVLFDSKSDSLQMENHLERKEIQEALSQGYGESRRYSVTLLERSLYCAQLLEDGTILRLSITQSSILTLLLGMAQPICVVIFIALLLSVMLAIRLSKEIVKPLNELNLDEPLSNEEYEELSPLLKRIDSQQKQLQWQQTELQRRQKELNAVVDNMKEGMILLNQGGRIISINPAAMTLLNADRHCVGADILTVSRNLDLQGLLVKALGGQQAGRTITFQNRTCQVDASPIISEGSAQEMSMSENIILKTATQKTAAMSKAPMPENTTPKAAVSGAVVLGVAVLFLDVTEKEKTEQLRREFTANVSHELKTPLHVISGYAELLQSGMAESKDTIPFAGKIYAEAQRMVQLIEDIISLSHLDEGADDMKWEEVDLYPLAEKVVQSLSPEAGAAGVTLKLSGETAVINGIPQLLYGILFNLGSNAIKYNRKEGEAMIEIRNEEQSAVILVSDTGIGIGAEHQERIFERFYRVDKSHSKEVGGTGLGLSIVKHAAKIHNAKIDLKSAVGEGTIITVRFPKQ